MQKKTKTLYFSIENMHCGSCVAKIEKIMDNTAEVDAASVNFADHSMSATTTLSSDEVVQTLKAAGYEAIAQTNIQNDDNEAAKEKLFASQMMKKIIAPLIIALPLLLSGHIYSFIPKVGEPVWQPVWFVIGILTLFLLFYAGGEIYQGAWQSIKNRSATMDTLIAMGTGTAWLYSFYVILFPETLPKLAQGLYFETALLIIALVNLGTFLEARARGKTSQAIKRLIGLQPKTARIVRDGKEIDIPIEKIMHDDILRVRPGEKIAVDGIIIEGHSTIDESMLTGEPLAVKKNIDSEVVAGTINKSGTFLYKALRVGSETALARIVTLVKEAQNSKPPIGRLVDRIAAWFVPIVILTAIITALIWYLVGPQPKILYMLITSVTVLIIACPCALGLGTPMSIMVGVGKAAEFGILIRNGEALQTTGKITTIVLDKTGTITEGKPSVTAIIPTKFSPPLSEKPLSEERLLQLAASLEAGSEHPLAEAVINAAKEKNIKLLSINHFEAIAGHGVKAEIEGFSVMLGNNKLMIENQIVLKDSQKQAQKLAAEGETPIYIAIDNQLAGIMAIADPIKKESESAIKRLHQMGLNVAMLTGDNKITAQSVAKKVGIDEVFAELLPEDKLKAVETLQNRGEIVGMVGDGINDAPSLAKANVGFAIGTGTDVAIESADVTLMRESLHGIPDAISISKATIKNIKQNLIGAFGYNILGIPVAAGILYPFIGILLHPIIAGAAMAASSLTIVINANRLRFFKPD